MVETYKISEDLYKLLKEALKTNPFYNLTPDKIDLSRVKDYKNPESMVNEEFKSFEDTYLAKLSKAIIVAFNNKSGQTSSNEVKYNWFFKYIYALALNDPNTESYKETKRDFILTVIKNSQIAEDNNETIYKPGRLMDRILFSSFVLTTTMK